MVGCAHMLRHKDEGLSSYPSSVHGVLLWTTDIYKITITFGDWFKTGIKMV